MGVPVAIQACTDYYPSESAFIVLDTTNYWAWGSDGWVTFSSAFECIDMNFDDLPFGDYLLILGDTYGDGGMSYSVTVDEDPAVTGVVTSCDVSPYKDYVSSQLHLLQLNQLTVQVVYMTVLVYVMVMQLKTVLVNVAVMLGLECTKKLILVR